MLKLCRCFFIKEYEKFSAESVMLMVKSVNLKKHKYTSKTALHYFTAGFSLIITKKTVVKHFESFKDYYGKLFSFK